MRILPVIDLMGGQVVRGVAGQRRAYRAIESRLVAGSQPADIARALATTFSAGEIYLADLDAIAGAEPAWPVYQKLVDCGLSLWIDAGIDGAARARSLSQFDAAPAIAGIIAGLESLPDAQTLAALVDCVGAERLVFSLDLKRGRPLTSAPGWLDLAPLEIVRLALAAGVRRMIVLDLAGVGMGEGVPTLALCRKIKELEPSIELTTGGGVRGPADLEALAAAGCDAALVASALHDGRITPTDAAAHRV